MNLYEEGKWLSRVTFLKAKNSVFNITDEIEIFSFTTPSCWFPLGTEEIGKKLHKLKQLTSVNGFELHEKEVRERTKSNKSR